LVAKRNSDADLPKRTARFTLCPSTNFQNMEWKWNRLSSSALASQALPLL
jgi:hypothetical protein